MNKRVNPRWENWGFAELLPLKSTSKAVGKLLWAGVAVAGGTVAFVLFVWQSIVEPPAGGGAEPSAASATSALVSGAVPTVVKDSIQPPSHLSPFGAAAENTTKTAVVAAALKSPVSVFKGPDPKTGGAVSVPGRLPTVTAAANVVSAGPPPRSDMRYQAATTWRRIMPH